VTGWLRRLVLWMVCTVCIGLPAGHARAEPLLWGGEPAHGTALTDAGGRWSADEALARMAAGQGAPYDESVFYPFSHDAAVWFRFDLPSMTTPAVLSIPHSGINLAEVFLRQADGNWTVLLSGDSIAVADWALRHLHPAFVVPTQAGQPASVLVRVVHNHPVTLPWRVWAEPDFHTANQYLLLLLGAYLGFVLLVVGLCAFNWFAWRDRLYLTAAFYVLSIGLTQVSLTGAGGQFVWSTHPVWNDYSSVILPLVSAVAAGWFTYRVVSERSGRGWRAALIVYCLAGLALIASFTGVDRNVAFRFANYYFLLCSPLCIVAMMAYAQRNPRVGWWFVAAFGVLFVGAVFAVLRNLGMLAMSPLTQFGAQVGAGIEVPLLMAGLHFRSRERRDNQARMSHLARVDPLTGLSSHRVLVERLDQQLRRGGADMAVLRVRVGNARQIQDEYGSDVLQTALVHAGACIGRVAREGDTVARHRNGDFVLLLGNAPSREQAGEAAQRIIARGLAHTSDLPEKQSLRLLVAASVPPLDCEDAEELLDDLQLLIEELQARPGKALRFLE
jgi:diguanylate cyclase (GGDEF)-like protein